MVESLILVILMELHFMLSLIIVILSVCDVYVSGCCVTINDVFLV